MERFVEHRNRLLSKMIESSSIKVFKKCANMALGDIMGCGEHSGGVRLTVGLNPKGLSQP